MKTKLPLGFYSAGISAGIKGQDAKDLGLIHSELPCIWGATFTTNSVKAHCVLDNQQSLLEKNQIRALIVNSGNANVCTGHAGLEALREIKSGCANILNLNESEVLTASTGSTATLLSSESIVSALPPLKNQLSSECIDFAEAILTTDSHSKISTHILSNGINITAIAKGAGMIHPNMATMLCFILTDGRIKQEDLQSALSEAVENSFNRISVDGDTSTNDMVICLANGVSEKEVDLEEFQAALKEVNQDLAQQIVADGEGANRVFEVNIVGAASEQEALQIARGISRSLLVKSAIFQGIPAWGRIIASAGQYGQVNISESELSLAGEKVFSQGEPQNFDASSLQQKIQSSSKIHIKLDVGHNTAYESISWGCDLSYDYVRINAAD